MATKILDVDLADGPRALDVPPMYRSTLLLLRWCGRPLGQVRMGQDGGSISAPDLWLAATRALGDRLIRAALEDLLPWPADPPDSDSVPLPSSSVVVCTRNRAEYLRRLLDSLCPTAGPDVEIIVIDNAPPNDRTEQLTAGYPVRYVREPRRGLNWARGHGARTASGDVVIYADDDVVVDRGWIDAMRRPFADPRVAGVTGLVMPAELETEAQEQFERFVGFGRGFKYREFSAGDIDLVHAASRVGTGASMAFRRELILGLGLFDIELDCGTPAMSGGDHYAFYSILKLGHVLVYNPQALSWHRHRRGLNELRLQLYGYSVGVCCWMLRSLLVHGEGPALSAYFWFFVYHLYQLWCCLRRREGAKPLSLALAEMRGVLAAPFALLASLLRERTAARPAVGAPSRRRRIFQE